MPDFDLQIALDRLAEAMLPDEEMRQQKANAAVISHDGGVHSRPLSQSLPWYRIDIQLPGAVSAAASIARIPFPQGGVIRHIAVSARVAPSSSLLLSISGSNSASMSLPAGLSFAKTGASIDVPSDGWAVIDVQEGGGAEDALVSLHYTPIGGT